MIPRPSTNDDVLNPAVEFVTRDHTRQHVETGSSLSFTDAERHCDVIARVAHLARADVGVIQVQFSYQNPIEHHRAGDRHTPLRPDNRTFGVAADRFKSTQGPLVSMFSARRQRAADGIQDERLGMQSQTSAGMDFESNSRTRSAICFTSGVFEFFELLLVAISPPSSPPLSAVHCYTVIRPSHCAKSCDKFRIRCRNPSNCALESEIRRSKLHTRQIGRQANAKFGNDFDFEFISFAAPSTPLRTCFASLREIFRAPRLRLRRISFRS